MGAARWPHLATAGLFIASCGGLGVTLQLLWEEYRAAHPDGYGYSRFCELYRTWEARLSPTIRQSHIAGERMFVDYAGTTLGVIDPTGAARTAQPFIAVLGVSNYTYAEATWTQGLSDWIGSHTRSFAFFSGVPAMVVSDNLRSASPKLVFKSRPSTAAMLRWRPITTPPLCRRGLIGRGTKRRLRSRRASSSPSCATGNSSHLPH